MPFNGERNLGVCVIQRLNKHKLNVSVTQLGGENFHQRKKKKKKTAELNRIFNNVEPRACSVIPLRAEVRALPDPARSRKKLFYTTENKSWVLPSFF